MDIVYIKCGNSVLSLLVLVKQNWSQFNSEAQNSFALKFWTGDSSSVEVKLAGAKRSWVSVAIFSTIDCYPSIADKAWTSLTLKKANMTEYNIFFLVSTSGLNEFFLKSLHLETWRGGVLVDTFWTPLSFSAKRSNTAARYVHPRLNHNTLYPLFAKETHVTITMVIAPPSSPAMIYAYCFTIDFIWNICFTWFTVCFT